MSLSPESQLSPSSVTPAHRGKLNFSFTLSFSQSLGPALTALTLQDRTVMLTDCPFFKATKGPRHSQRNQ